MKVAGYSWNCLDEPTLVVGIKPFLSKCVIDHRWKFWKVLIGFACVGIKIRFLLIQWSLSNFAKENVMHQMEKSIPHDDSKVLGL